MTRRCVLHLGAEKTGTTSLQGHFLANRAAYRAAGILYPEAGCLDRGGGVHKGISRALKRLDGAESDAILKALACEIEAAADCHTVLISSEFFHSEVRAPGPANILRDLLRPLVDRVELVLYVRRQDRLAISMYSTGVRGGWNADPSPLSVLRRKGDYYFDFARVAATWTTVFGAEALKCRVYGPGALVNDNIIDDFCRVAGISPMSGNRELALNSSPGWRTLEVMRRFNASGLAGDEVLRGQLWRQLSSLDDRPAPRLTRAEAEGIVSRFAASNRILARDVIGIDCDTPFDDDFSAYPETLPPFGEDELLRTMIECFRS